MANDRSDTARSHDDSVIIKRGAPPTPDEGGREGGNLQRDIGSEAEQARVDDPERRTRATKQDDIDNDDAYPSNRPRD